MKRLIFRLSSMGDIILSQAALEVPYAGTTDWVTSAEFKSLFENHPKLNRVWFFSRKNEGLSGWLKLNIQLYREGYDEVIDLHSSLRTQMARWVFFFASLYQGHRFPKWKTYRKKRIRRLGYVLFKDLWPKRWRPIQFAEASAKLAGGTGLERPNFRHLLSKKTAGLHPFSDTAKHYAVMPASTWKGKEWGVDHFFEFIQKGPDFIPIILGTEKDQASRMLVQKLIDAKIIHQSMVGKLQLAETAQVLSEVRFLISNDTGLSHLAEAVGATVFAIYGPTTPDFGFALSNPKSLALHSGIWCAPCSKDGQLCFRVVDRFACMKRFQADSVVKLVGKSLDPP